MNDKVLEILCESPLIKLDTLYDALYAGRKEPSTLVIKSVLRLKKDDYKELNKSQRDKLGWMRDYIFKQLEGLHPSACYNLLFATYRSLEVDLSEYLIFVPFIDNRYAEVAYPNLYKVIESFKKEEN